MPTDYLNNRLIKLIVSALIFDLGFPNNQDAQIKVV